MDTTTATTSYTQTNLTPTDNAVAATFLLTTTFIWLVVMIIISVILIIGLWKVFKKAGKPGWAAIVPIYNVWVLFEIVGYPGWWAILTFVPLASIFPAIMTFVSYYKLGALFGKETGFSVCLVLFPYVTIPMLGFGKAQFKGTQPSTTPASAPQDSAPSTATTTTPPSTTSAQQPQTIETKPAEAPTQDNK